jgi:hypothetical protein
VNKYDVVPMIFLEERYKLYIEMKPTEVEILKMDVDSITIEME